MASRRSKWDDAGVDHADHPHLLPSQPHSSDTLSNRPIHLQGMLHGGASQDHSNTELAELYGLNPSLISTTSVVVSEAAPILREVDINNCKNRYMLTKSQTLHEVLFLFFFAWPFFCNKDVTDCRLFWSCDCSSRKIL